MSLSKVRNSLLGVSAVLGVLSFGSNFAQAAGGYQTACNAWCPNGASCWINATDFSFAWTSDCEYYGSYVECYTTTANGAYYQSPIIQTCE